jgi:hypothetical protein
MVLATVARARIQITAELSAIVDYCMLLVDWKTKSTTAASKKIEGIKVTPFLARQTP